MVTRSRGSATAGGQVDVRRRPAGPRPARRPRPPCPAPARPPPARATPPTTRSVSCWVTASSVVAKVSACSARPSSISETTVCSWLADSCACALSASAKPRIVFSSLTSARSSVWSRTVTTVPSRRPSQRAAAWLTTTIRSSVRKISSARSTPASSATPERLRQPDLVDPVPQRRVRHPEQPARLVVDQAQPALPVEQQQTLAHRVQHRVVVLVHPAQLGRAEVVRAAPQPPAGQPGAQPGQQQRDHRGAEQDRQLPAQLLAHPADRLAHRDQPADLPVHPHRHHRAHRRPERPGEGLGERVALLRGRDRAQEVPADLGRVGMGEPDAVGRHDDHEVGAGVPADLLGEGLQHGAGIGRGQPRRARSASQPPRARHPAPRPARRPSWPCSPASRRRSRTRSAPPGSPRPGSRTAGWPGSSRSGRRGQAWPRPAHPSSLRPPAASTSCHIAMVAKVARGVGPAQWTRPVGVRSRDWPCTSRGTSRYSTSGRPAGR